MGRSYLLRPQRATWWIRPTSQAWSFSAMLLMRVGGWPDLHGAAKSSHKHTIQGLACTHAHNTYTGPWTLSAVPAPPAQLCSSRVVLDTQALADTGTLNIMVDMDLSLYGADVRQRIRSPGARPWPLPIREQFLQRSLFSSEKGLSKDSSRPAWEGFDCPLVALSGIFSPRFPGPQSIHSANLY